MDDLDYNPLFSILIANYNREKYIEETIQSVFDQTYDNWEIIIVDDGSTDNSKKIIKGFAGHPKIKVLFNEKNRGIGYTKRRCVEESSGELFGILDPDDTLAPSALEKMVRMHGKHKDASLIYSQLYYCNEKLEPLKIPEYNCQIPEGTSFLEYRKGPSAFASVKRSYYNKTEGIDPFLKISEDTDMYLKLEEVGKLIFLPEPLYYYRNNPGSISLNENVVRSHVWRAIVIAAACRRRKLDREDLIVNYFVEKDRKWRERQDEVRQTLQFKIGHFLLWPAIKIREIFKR